MSNDIGPNRASFKDGMFPAPEMLGKLSPEDKRQIQMLARRQEKGVLGEVASSVAAKVVVALGLVAGLAVVCGVQSRDPNRPLEPPKMVEAMITGDPDVDNTLRCLWVKFKEVADCDTGVDEVDWAEQNCDKGRLESVVKGSIGSEAIYRIANEKNDVMHAAEVPRVEWWVVDGGEGRPVCSQQE